HRPHRTVACSDSGERGCPLRRPGDTLVTQLAREGRLVPHRRTQPRSDRMSTPTEPLDSTATQPIDRALAEPTTSVSKLWVFWLFVASIGLWSGFFGPIQVLLAKQSEAIAPDHKETVLALVTGVGAAVSMVLNPLWGAFSDRTTSRFGRRLPW